MSISECRATYQLSRSAAFLCVGVMALLFALVEVSIAQQLRLSTTIDSLRNELQRTSPERERIETLIALSSALVSYGASEAETTPVAEELLDLAQRSSNERGVAWGLCFVARRYEYRDNILFSRYAYDALHRFDVLRDTLGLAFAERAVASSHFYQADYDLALRFYNQALERFEQVKYIPQVAWMMYYKGILYGYQGNYIFSLSNQFKALRLFEQLGITLGAAASNKDLGVALQKIGSLNKALEYFRKSLAEFRRHTSTKARSATVYLHIAECYEARSDTAQALVYLDSAIVLARQDRSTFGIIALSGVEDLYGNIARQQGNISRAKEYFRAALQVLDSANIRGNDANFAVYRLGTLAFALKDYAAASVYFHDMLERSLRSGDKRNSSRAMLWLGKAEYELNNITDATRYGREALAAAKNIGQLEFATSSAEILAKIYEQSDTKTSLGYTKLARSLRDSIATLERSQQLAGLEALYNLDREQSLSELLRKDNQTQTIIATRQRWLLIVVGVMLLGVLVGAIILRRLNARMKSTNEELERQTIRIHAISKIGAEIASNLNMERAIVMIYQYINQLMDASILNIGDYLPHESSIKMRFLIEKGEFAPPPTVKMSETHRPAVRCVLERRAIVMNDEDIPVLVGVKPASLVYVPLISGERVIGVFSVQSLKKNSYPPENVELLMAISAYITTALQNASAFAQIQVQQTELEQQAAAIQLANTALSERNVHLEQLTGKITDNIAYAKTIQHAILPLESEITETLGEHFILYKPMEMISGDFYWLQRSEFSTLVAVIDCTGHGIPGAFMSMVGNDLLNQIVLEKGITSPGWILTELHYAIRHALKQTNDIDSNQDGMDVCLCRIDDSGITFAGARRPLYIVQNGEILTIEGDTKPVGGFQREAKRQFSSKRLDLDLSSPTMLYLTSDGYADQNNRITREKFGTERLERLFTDIASKDMATQRTRLEQALAAHQDITPQRDDITLMGIRLAAR
ncbi:MAG: GAF domain-containing protein [Candidatus Kapaibacterium sp.]|nr:MAG: GAF domain-containing protein [Candidatus Kapabacteria bacterium]